ncbi:hypothetical protein IV203_030303 [Nitzschia inconspicua]|uniref:tRNA ligase phosphodiesterase domain-containing protein n=1 Tax=Nitzschia inconspicua TaxID=303405 RepID=A0A9K3Q161_9STRA|nr:hypothetical protein IV203_030303 [Nitzschia inconspicua]
MIDVRSQQPQQQQQNPNTDDGHSNHQQNNKNNILQTTLDQQAAAKTNDSIPKTDRSKKRSRQQREEEEGSSEKIRQPPKSKTEMSKEISMETENQVMIPSSSSPAATGTSTFLDNPHSTTINPESIKGLRLEAIFHPKFDNEKRNKQSRITSGNATTNSSVASHTSDVRRAMMERLSNDKGYLEVSLKHSGSLILWSGGQRYYSKNSCRNQFTQVAEILLRQHFVRAFWNKNQNNTSCDNSEIVPVHDLSERHYQECSNYLQQHRLTCAFEVVTAVLGDHGQIPKRDFLIVTAVADRNHERFFTTLEVLDFCQRFRLPHNDIWTFESVQSAQQLFDVYDTIRETGLANDTIQALTNAADAYVPSMYPHDIFQGEILEGFIIRYVSTPQNKQNSDTEVTENIMKRLGNAALEIQQKSVPPELPPSFVLVADTYNQIETIPSTVLTTDVRSIFQTVSEVAENERGKLFQEQLAAVLQQTRTDPSHSTDTSCRDISRHDLTRVSNIDGRVHLPSLVKHLATDDPSIQDDAETRRIAQLLQTLDSIKGVVQYSLFTLPEDDRDTNNDNEHSSARLFCMVHVMHDTTFFKFQKLQEPGDMALFRGFCVELLAQPSKSSNTTPHQNGSAVIDVNDTTNPDDEQPLMLKMKLLPYMIRTFICRNLLKVLEKDGPNEFCQRAEALMERWGISPASIQKWSPFITGWAQYVLKEKAKIADTTVNDPNHVQNLGPLNSDLYFRHLEHYTKLYNNGEIKVTNFDDVAGPGSFQPLVCVVAVRNEISKAVAMFLAQRLGKVGESSTTGTVATSSTGCIMVKSLQDAIISKVTKSCVVYTCIGEKNKGAKAFFNNRKVLKYSIVILYGSESTNSMEDSDELSWFGAPSDIERKRISSVWEKLWKKQPCGKQILLPRDAIQFEPKYADSSEATIASTSSEVDNLVATIQATSKQLCSEDVDKQKDPSKRSILVLFPGIPGCGKSSVVNSLDSGMRKAMKEKLGMDETDRRVFVKEGDKIGKQFWDVTESILSGENDPTPALCVADKNIPPASWPKIGQICSDTRSIPLLVLPDRASMETTTVEGAIFPDGTFRAFYSHFYPFSLKYLAISLERVLGRPAGKHSGKLDSGLPTAGMVVVKFFAFYRDMSADTLGDLFDSKLEESGAKGLQLLETIELPFLSSAGKDEPLPQDLEALLVEALQLRLGYDRERKAKDNDERILEFETRLRSCVEKHRGTIQSMSANLEETRSSLTTQLLDRLSTLNRRNSSTEGRTQPSDLFSKIKLVSLDVDRTAIHKLLSMLKDRSGNVKDFFNVALPKSFELANESNEECSKDSTTDSYLPTCFVSQTHVTMAFAGRKLSAKSLVTMFSHLQGRKVTMKVTRFLWSKTHAAFAVEIDRTAAQDDSTVVPACENSFPHITVWCAPGSHAYHSNRLPALLENGEAQELAITPHAELVGTLCFWNHDNQPFEIEENTTGS